MPSALADALTRYIDAHGEYSRMFGAAPKRDAMEWKVEPA